MGVMYSELAAIYSAMRRGNAPPQLPQLPVQYVDYSAWQRARLERGELEAQRAYWRQQLAGVPQLLELPTDFPRPASFSDRCGSVPVAVPAAQARALRALAASCGATTFMALLAVWQVRAEQSEEAAALAGSSALLRYRATQCGWQTHSGISSHHASMCLSPGAAQPLRPR